MIFKTHNQTEVPFAGTHLQGYVDTTYDDLVSLFGEPVRSYPGSRQCTTGRTAQATWDQPVKPKIKSPNGTLADSTQSPYRWCYSQ